MKEQMGILKPTEIETHLIINTSITIKNTNAKMLFKGKIQYEKNVI